MTDGESQNGHNLRKTLIDALGYAVAAGREHIELEDVRIKASPGRSRIGF